MSSVRASKVVGVNEQERVIKRVKTRDKDAGVVEVTMEEVFSNKKDVGSFKEALLNTPGLSGGDDVAEEDWNVKDDDMPENKWYKEDVEQLDMSHAEGIPVIPVSDEELNEWSNHWSKTLVINVLGKRVNYRALENKLKREWAKVGPINIIDMPRGYFAVRFDKDEDYNHALFQGPWMIADHYILVQRWRRNFLVSATKEKRVAVWVRIPELPLELYNDKFLKRVGASLGVMLKIDRLTSIHSRGQFARLCMELDLEKPVVPQVKVRGVVLNLVYEGLHTICFHCGVYRHRESDCNLKKVAIQMGVTTATGLEVVQQSNNLATMEGTLKNQMNHTEASNTLANARGCGETSKIVVEGGEDSGPVFGPWMVVSKSRKGRSKGAAKGSEKSTKVEGSYQIKGQRKDMEAGSRFKSLQGEEGAEEHMGVNQSVEKGKAVVEVSTTIGNGPELSKSPMALTQPHALGGKKVQLGQSFRQTKKVARVRSPLKKGVLNSPKFKPGLLKENINPNPHKGGPSSKKQLKMEEARKILTKGIPAQPEAPPNNETGKIPQPTQTLGSESNSTPLMVQQPLDMEIEVSKINAYSEMCKSVIANMQNDAKLSEQKSQKTSI